MKLQNISALITGASSGIGEACAMELAKRGCDVTLVGRRMGELERVAAEIQTVTGKSPLKIAGDITVAADRKKIAETIGKTGHLSLLINNAGVTAHGRFDRTVPGVLEKAIETNLYGAVYPTQALLPVMRGTPGQKKIVYVSTPSGLHGIPERFAYSASKAAAGAWMEAIRVELKEHGFDTLMFFPGYTRTALRSTGFGEDGSTISEAQDKGAKEPNVVARMLIRGIEKDKRNVFTNLTGPFVYYARTLAPWLLESILVKKLKKDFRS